MALRSHLPALALSVLCGLLLYAPQLIAVWRMGDAFQGVYPETRDDQLYYQARAQEVADGYSRLGNAYLAEYKDAASVQLSLPDMLMAYPLAALGVSMPEGFRLFDLFIAPVAVFLTYLFFLALTGRRWMSTALAGTLWLGLFLTELGRSPSPQWNIIPFVAFALCALRAYASRRVAYAAAAGILLGFLFYTYFYYWTYAAALLGILALADMAQRRVPREALVALGLGFLIGAPYLAGVAALRGLPEYADTLARMGAVASRIPSGILIVGAGLVLLCLAALVVFRSRASWTPTFAFAASGVLAGIVATNQHLITGLNLEFSSHYQLPFAFFALALIAHLLENAPRVARITALCIAALLVLAGVYNELRLIDTHRDAVLAQQQYGPALSWLRAHAAPGDTVLANTELSLLVPAYTSLDVVHHPYAGYFLMSTSELQERYLIAHPENDFANADAVRSVDSRVLFGLEYITRAARVRSENVLRTAVGLSPKENVVVSDTDVTGVAMLAKEAASMTAAERLARYRTDYVIATSDDPLSAEAEEAGYTQVGEAGGFVIYHEHDE